MKKFIHNVLGTDYEVMIGNREELNIAEEHAGEVRVFAKQILICTSRGDCTVAELRVKVQEVVAHEFLHAYFNEAGVDVEESNEESICSFYMKNWRKLNNSILEVLDQSGFLDK